MDRIIDSLVPKSVERVAGSANKFVHMVEKKSDFYINLVPGFKNWDMVGSEAIMQASFGIVTDSELKPINYSHHKSEHTLSNGIIAAKNKRFLDVCVERIEEEVGSSVSDCQRLVATQTEESKRIRKL